MRRRTGDATEKRRSQPRDSGPHIFRHPFNDLSKEEVEQFLKELGKASEQGFPSKLAELRSRLHSFDGELLLAQLAFHCLTGLVEVGGKVVPNSGPVKQHHLEILQALYLATDQSSHEPIAPTPRDTQEVADLLVEISDAFQHKRAARILKANAGLERRQLQIQEQLRAVTQVVRNWGFLDAMIAIMREWAQPIDVSARTALGFTFTDLLDVVEAVLDQHADALQGHFRKLKRVFETRSKRRLVDAFAREFLDPDDGPREMEELLRSHPELSFQSLRFVLSVNSSYFASDIFHFSEQDLVRRLRRRKLALDPHAILQALSITPGSLQGRELEHFFLDNPIWTRPLIAAGGASYSAPLAPVLLHSIWDIVRSVAAANLPLQELVQKRRSRYLEDVIANLCRVGFPEAQIGANSQFGPAFEYENDLLVLMGEFALVIEAKSGAPRLGALRGGPDSFRDTVNELIVEPLTQSHRFAAWIGTQHGNVTLPRRDGGTNEFDLSAVRYVLRLVVLLEDVASIHALPSQLQKAGLIDAGIPLALIVTLADLRILFDLLPSEAEKFHYLWRRQRFESAIDLLADELDLLGLYLQTGFNVGELDGAPARLILTGMSSAIDTYYERRRIGFRPRKPRLPLSRWWQDMLERLSTERPRRWLELSVKLLHVSPRDQRHTYRGVRRLVARIARNPPFNEIDSNAFVFLSGHAQRRDAFVFLAYRAAERPVRDQWMQNVAAQALKQPGVTCAVVCTICVDRNDWPYSSLALFSIDPEGPWLSNA